MIHSHNFFFKVIIGWMLALAVFIFCVHSAQAASFSRSSSFSSSRSYSTPSYSYRPSPPPRVAAPVAPAPRPVVIQRNTVVQQNVTHVQQGSGGGGGGFFSTFTGGLAGSALGSWLFGHKEQPSAQQAIDCQIEQNKALQICQPVK